MADRKQVKNMADRLISTLASGMEPERADAIVRDVAIELYRDVLGIPGSIVVDTSQPSGYVHVGGMRGVKKTVVPFASFKFEPEAKV